MQSIVLKILTALTIYIRLCVDTDY